MSTHEAVVSEADVDFGSDAKPALSEIERGWATLDQLCSASEIAAREVERAEAALAEAKRVQKDLDERQIPELMDTVLHMKECTSKSGYKVTVKSALRATLPPHEERERRERALAWLMSNGHAGIIKNKIAVDLAAGDDTRAAQLAVQLVEQGFDVFNEKTAHPATLSKLLKELLEDGTAVPRDLFGVFDQRVAKIKKI